jgi:glycerate kinase
MSSTFVVVCAPDKLRGALTAPAAAAALGTGVRAAGATAVEHPLADGGEGTRTTLAAGTGRTITVRSVDALGRPHDVPVSLLPDGTAVLEAA